MFKKILAVLLCAALTVPALVSCSESGTNTETSTDTKNEVQTSEEGENAEDAGDEERIRPDIPEKADYGGDNINFLVWTHSAWQNTVREYRDIYAEGITGEAINDVVYNRNVLIETNYNVAITEDKQDLGQIDSLVSKAVTAGDTNYDVVYPRLYEAASMYQKNYFINLYDVPHIDFSKPWWDSNCVDSMSICGILPAVATSINVNDKDATVAVAFSKDEAENYGVEDLYTAVREGRWTLDLISSIAEATYRDLDGNGVITVDDFYGLLGGSDVMSAFWHGGGGQLCTKDENGLFTFSFGSERDINVAVKVVNLMNQVWFMNHHLISNTDDAYYTQLFETGHGMFFWMRLDEVTNMRNGDTEFGILPTPKYEEAQELYYSFVSQHTTGILSIPLTVSGDALDELGIVLEALAAESHYTLIPEYIESSLKTKYSRDAESGGMLDIIINNRIFDPMFIYNWGGYADTFQNYGSNNTTDIASSLAKSQKVVNKLLDKFIQSMQDGQ